MCLHMKKLGMDGGYRKERGEFLCDGRKLLEEAVKCGAGITAVLASSRLPFPLPDGTRLYHADRAIIDSISPMKNAQNILFTCKMPQPGGGGDNPVLTGAAGTHIMLDGIQDPGNVGSIIRTADAFGVKIVLLAGGCADPYNPKTIRATMGAVFRQRIRHVSDDELSALRENGARIIGAAPGGGSRDFSEIDFRNSIIAIGSEGSGLSGHTLALCAEMAAIPISPECESLNAAVAAGIILWKASRDNVIT